MTISMYQASVPVFTRALANLANVLKKGEAFAREKHQNPDQLLQQRLIFDMFPLVKQVQIACDTAKNSVARMAAVEPKAFADTEITLAQAHARIQATIDYLNTFKAAQIDGCEDHTVIHKTRGGDIPFKGIDFLRNYALPNFFFHCTTAYAILRVAGCPVGKRDFLG